MATQQPEPVQEAVRAKVRTALSKSLPAELSTTIENKLATAFPTSAAYTSAYRSLVALLKPRADTLAPDAAFASAAASAAGSNGKSSVLKDSQGLPATGEWSHVAADLTSGKMRVGKLINRLQETEKQKRTLLAQSGAAAAAAGANSSSAANNAASSNLDSATAAAVRARGLGLLTQRIHSAKARLADKSASKVEDPLAWEEVADCSAQLFLQHVCNEGYLLQALQAYKRVEKLSAEHTQKYPAFWLKRSNLHVVAQDYAAAIEDLEKFAQIKGTITVPAAAAAAPATAGSSDAAAASSAAPAAAAASVTLSYAALAAPRLQVVRQFVATTSRLLGEKMRLSPATLADAVANLPNPSERDLKRKVVPLSALQPGANEGSALVGRLLARLDQSSLFSLASSERNPRVSGGEGSGVGLGPVLPHQPYDALESRFRTPLLYAMLDTQGQMAVLALTNLAIDPTSSAAAKAKFKAKLRPTTNGSGKDAASVGSSLVLLDPTVIEVNVPGEHGGRFTVVQVRNPYAVFSGNNQADRRDMEQVFAAEDIATSADF